MLTDDLTRWALNVPIPRTAWHDERGREARIGADRVRLVLVALVQYANRDLEAWPSRRTLSSDLFGLHERDVRTALAVLDRSGVTRAVRSGRIVRRTILADVAGLPATSGDHLAGSPTQSHGEPAGSAPTGGEPRQDPKTERAGESAGNMAGSPAANQNQNQACMQERSRECSDVSAVPDVANSDGAAEISAVILGQPCGSQFDGRSAWAQRLHEHGWTASALAAEFAAHPITDARTAGLLRTRLQELAATAPPPRPRAPAPPSRCPVHGASPTGTCQGCAGDHRGGEHSSQADGPSAACNLCRESRSRAT